VSKGQTTRRAILDEAFRLAACQGLDALTIGGLAEILGMSKSGLFAHFGSKEGLQLAVIDHAAERFTERVVRPTLKAERGLPRLRALFEHWLRWQREEVREGGCFFISVAFELDARPGPTRTRVVALQLEFVEMMVRIVQGAVQEGHLRADLDAEQLAHDLYGVMLVTQHYARLLDDPRAEQRGQRGFEALLRAAAVAPSLS
jgi:AcrR family transcriptional regulator